MEKELEREKLKVYIVELVDQSFSSFLPREIIKNNYGNRITKLLKRDNFILLAKIRSATFPSKKLTLSKVENTTLISIDKVPFYFGSLSNNLFDGNGVLYNEEGSPKYEGVFKQGRFVSGKAREYFDDGSILYEVDYEQDVKKRGYMLKPQSEHHTIKYYFKGDFAENEILSGITTKFNNHLVMYEGEVKNREFSGYGVFYSKGKVKYKGDFKKGLIVEGEEFNGKFYFKGTFKNGKPWSGEVRNFSNKRVKEFKGQLLHGNPHDGSGLVFQRDHEDKGRDYYEWKEENYDNYIGEELNYDQQEEWIKEQNNQSIREKYRIWDDFIMADWDNGGIKEWDDKEANKEVYYDPNSKRDKK